MSDDLTTDDLILKRTRQEIAPDMVAENEKLRAAKNRWMKLADERAVEASTLKVENEKLRAALVQIRGFVHVMSPENWLDVRLYIERQCDVLDHVEQKSGHDG